MTVYKLRIFSPVSFYNFGALSEFTWTTVAQMHSSTV
jgi:hypothetical protein